MHEARWVLVGLAGGLALAFVAALLRPRRRPATVYRGARDADGRQHGPTDRVRHPAG